MGITQQQKQALLNASQVIAALREKLHEGLTRQLSKDELLAMWNAADSIHNIPSDVARDQVKEW